MKNASFNYKRLLANLALIAFLMLPIVAMAGAAAGGGEADEFAEIYEWVKTLCQGTLGKLIALVMIIVGIAMGVARGSIFSFVTGIAAAIGFYFVPNIIESVMGASLPLLA